jgi:hypothetical protein
MSILATNGHCTACSWPGAIGKRNYFNAKGPVETLCLAFSGRLYGALLWPSGRLTIASFVNALKPPVLKGLLIHGRESRIAHSKLVLRSFE